MKKLLTILVSVMLLFSLTSKAQNDLTWALSPQGGYSWINGVLGADLQIGHVGFGVGWMPTSMPSSGTRVNSIGFQATYYSELWNEFGYYASIGVASDGYRYEYSGSYNDDGTAAMTIAMLGIKGGGDRFFWKAGVGYGWCEEANSWTGEFTIGIPIFTNYNFN